MICATSIGRRPFFVANSLILLSAAAPAKPARPSRSRFCQYAMLTPKPNAWDL